MQIKENADGSVSVQSGFDEYENEPEFVTQYHTNVDELSPQQHRANEHIEQRAQNKKIIETKAKITAARVAQVEQINKDKKTWLKTYLEDVRQAAHAQSMFGSLEFQESGFDISHAYVSPINELSGNMTLSRQQSDNLGTSFYLPTGEEDYGMKIVEPGNYNQKITDVQDDFGYTLVTGDMVDRASVSNAKSKIANDRARNAIMQSRNAKIKTNAVLHANIGPIKTIKRLAK